MQAYKTMPQAGKMDLRAFWACHRCIISLWHYGRWSGLAVFTLCYSWYIADTNCQNSAKNEKKNPQGKVPCGFSFVHFLQTANVIRKNEVVKIYKKIYFLYLLEFSLVNSCNLRSDSSSRFFCRFLLYILLRGALSVVSPIFYLLYLLKSFWWLLLKFKINMAKSSLLVFCN